MSAHNMAEGRRESGRGSAQRQLTFERKRNGETFDGEIRPREQRDVITELDGARITHAERMEPSRPRLDEDDLVTVAEAARIAKRSVRTIRRAYLSGRLVAHRDGNGRRVSIRCGDLRGWLTAETIASAPHAAASRPSAHVEVPNGAPRRGATGNLELLIAVRQRHARHARACGTARPGPKRAESGSA